jgi:hypothetical protein
VLSTLRKDLTATAAHTRSAALCLAKEGRRLTPVAGLRAAAPASYSWQAFSNDFGGICRMPSVPATLDPSQQQEEGRP